ncbi:hypothetical protein F0L17_01985 [Streptomyces sp. TRM43335]|uniref:Uncharacterized protein n=1 Tax=Streptomyces taklimakanensis TaxID=2569853 RepID=A0A6G2B6N6_9ACTN|nr:hypothetical protein [Streptomyces taklimakanensis]MTE17921.1 hypothetical protein [Streptomyces taklimakanensis]
MAAMVWLLIPFITGIGAVTWAVYAQRPRRGDLWDTSTRHARMRDALGRSLTERSGLQPR